MSAGSPEVLAERPITERAAESRSFASVTALSTKPDVGNPVAFVNTAADGVPRLGVTKVGEVANTKEPVPVSTEITPANTDSEPQLEAVLLEQRQERNQDF